MNNNKIKLKNNKSVYPLFPRPKMKTWYIHDSYRSLKWVYAKDKEQAAKIFLEQLVIEPSRDDFLAPDYKE